MLRGINRQDIFEDDEDYRQMTGCLRSLTERYDDMITRTVPMISLPLPLKEGEYPVNFLPSLQRIMGSVLLITFCSFCITHRS